MHDSRIGRNAVEVLAEAVMTPPTGMHQRRAMNHCMCRRFREFVGAIGAVFLLVPIAASADDGSALGELQRWCAAPAEERPAFDSLTLLDAPLSAAAARDCADLLWADLVQTWQRERQTEWDDRTLTVGDHTLRFTVQEFGEKPEEGWSVYISLHGGGEAPTQLNDQQWQNQQRLYRLDEGLYITPRAPTDTWNMWHQDHIDVFFERLIQDLVAFSAANADRVYLLGYSAGGDGVYQVAPRMADRFAAASMMAGHPNESSPLGLRNLPFAIHLGALDDGYGRNTVAAEWGRRLNELHAVDPGGYVHVCELHDGKGHWMDLKDAVALKWMSEFTRQPAPKRVVWRQDDVLHSSFYWLSVPVESVAAGNVMTAEIEGQTIDLRSESVEKVKLLLNDDLVNLDQPVTVRFNDQLIFEGIPPRTVRTIHETLHDRGDRRLMYSATREIAR